MLEKINFFIQKNILFLKKSPTKQLAHTIQKCTLQCIPTTHQKTHVDYPPRPQRALDLANVVPSTPISGFT